MRIVMFASICSLAICLLLSGCSSVSNAPGSGKKVDGSKATQDVRKTIERRLAEGSLTKAHVALSEALREEATETSLADVYTEVENSLLRNAQRFGDEGRFDKAAKFYRMAMDTYPKSPQLRSSLVMTREDVEKKIDECADELMKSGLMAYRAGELVEAVSIWEKIALFSPDHSPSKVAIKTAKEQIKTLERLSSGK